jgi:iron(II)-dependent oxidoreductase
MRVPILFAVLMALLVPSYGQITSFQLDKPNTVILTGVQFGKVTVPLPYGLPLFSLLIDSNFYTSYCTKPEYKGDEIIQTLADSIRVIYRQDRRFSPGIKYVIRFENLGKRSHRIENVVPLGEGTDKVYITAGGTMEWPHYLCRSLLFRPGFGPIGIILPDNAWHIGFADFAVNDTISVVAMARRGQREKDRTSLDRWAVTLKEGGWAEYSIYADVHSGDWHTGLKMMFQERWLYDLEKFDTALFSRQDLKWMRSRYIMLLQFAWDKKFYDYKTQRYNFYKSFFEFDSLTGGYDIFTLWPTWPRLGLDQRNQWDMYRDLPGGLTALREQSDLLHSKGRKYFISYNPWDESSRKEDHFKGMEELLKAIDADGVCLDTRGASSFELQATADKVKPGIIMYSEGMAIPKDMPGIVSGRVHDALVLPPPINMNKLIKPDFAIFRVLQLADDRLHRELACAFFNGYGVEINTMRPGRPAWIEEEYAYMGRTTKLLRENDDVFHNYGFYPLLPTLTDSVYVNRWTNGNKVLFTIYSLKPEGFEGLLFEIEPMAEGTHCVDLWHHREIQPVIKDGKTLLPVPLEPFDRAFLNTRQEGNVGCIVILPMLLKASLRPDTLYFSAAEGDEIVITPGDPSYCSKSFRFPPGGGSFAYWEAIPEGSKKLVVQLFANGQLLDERVLPLIHNLPRLITRIERTVPADVAPPGMVEIPAGKFRFYTKRDPKALEAFIPFPDLSDTVAVPVKRFFMDTYPVTNEDFATFIEATGYDPSNDANFLKHWTGGKIPAGQERMPVIWVNRDDALAYARWGGKRLPSEIEWQYAAQGSDMRTFPWGAEMDSTKCNYNLNVPTTVNAFPDGASPFGVKDLIGNVWQLTNDVYDNGCYYYEIIRGGSYYHPTASIWYVTGGPVPADHPEMLLLISPGLDRNATVGFRCVKDAE